MKRELFTRYEGNPILTPEMWPYPVARVFNPASVFFNGQTLLLVRVECRMGYSHLTLAESEDGKTNWKVKKKATLCAEEGEKESELGLEDPRIIHLEEENIYMISCVSFRSDFLKNPHSISIIGTRNFVNFDRISRPLLPVNKNACLFPKRINGRFALIHRPFIDGQAYIAVSFSPDLAHWGGLKPILTPISGTWCGFRVGLAAQPIETPYGWLIIFHGSKDVASKTVYSIGLALLDLETLDLIHRAREWVFAPRMDYEGGTGGIVFSCGATVKDNDLNMYYGADDYSIALATTKLDEVLDYLMKCPEK